MPDAHEGINDKILVQGVDREDDPWYQLRQSLDEFLAVPLVMFVGAIGLGLGVLALERANPAWLRPVRTTIGRYFFSTSGTTEAFLGAVSGGVITMTSIIFSMLLIMLQQSANNMGNMIYDQFLNRHGNQFYVGLIVGSVILTLIQSAAVSDTFNPILGATVVTIVVFLALAMLVYFLYSAINQMRPEYVVGSIKEETLQARKEYRAFLKRTRRERRLAQGSAVNVHTSTSGYLRKIDLDYVAAVLRDAPAEEVEIRVLKALGAYIAYVDCVAEVAGVSRREAQQVAQRLGRAFHFAGQRAIGGDPAFGLQQLEMVAWTEISSAKQNPETGLMVGEALGDLLARWIEEEQEMGAPPETEPLPVVYKDGVLDDLLGTFESLAIVSAESKQQQNYAEILREISPLLARMSPDLLEKTEATIERILPALDQHMLVRKLDRALLRLIGALEALGRKETAARVYEARQRRLEQSKQSGQSG